MPGDCTRWSLSPCTTPSTGSTPPVIALAANTRSCRPSEPRLAGSRNAAAAAAAHAVLVALVPSQQAALDAALAADLAAAQDGDVVDRRDVGSLRG